MNTLASQTDYCSHTRPDLLEYSVLSGEVDSDTDTGHDSDTDFDAETNLDTDRNGK